jgi:prepilin-type N-terminal cleavage/methylation domain-containing protein
MLTLKPKLERKSGFTLVELLVVLLIMSVIFAMTVPALINCYSKYKLNTAALKLQQEIRDTSQLSLHNESRFYNIKFYPYFNMYIINGPGGSKTMGLPAGIEMVATNFSSDTIYFSTRGAPTQGGHISLRSTETLDLKFIIVAPVTGRTRISDTSP